MIIYPKLYIKRKKRDLCVTEVGKTSSIHVSNLKLSVFNSRDMEEILG